MRPVSPVYLTFEQGGFHELQNEPDGVKEKLAEEVITFVDAHSPTDPASSLSKL